MHNFPNMAGTPYVSHLPDITRDHFVTIERVYDGRSKQVVSSPLSLCVRHHTVNLGFLPAIHAQLSQYGRYAMLIPALLMGNTAVLKLPTVGGLVHVLTAHRR